MKCPICGEKVLISLHLHNRLCEHSLNDIFILQFKEIEKLKTCQCGHKATKHDISSAKYDSDSEYYGSCKEYNCGCLGFKMIVEERLRDE